MKKTHITFYRSILCPRCYIARRYLKELTDSNPSLVIEEVDILLAPGRTWRDGIRMIPAMKIGSRILSAVYLSKDAIAGFIGDTML